MATIVDLIPRADKQVISKIFKAGKNDYRLTISRITPGNYSLTLVRCAENDTVPVLDLKGIRSLADLLNLLEIILTDDRIATMEDKVD